MYIVAGNFQFSKDSLSPAKEYMNAMTVLGEKNRYSCSDQAPLDPDKRRIAERKKRLAEGNYSPQN